MRDFGTNFGIATRLKRVGLPRTRSNQKSVCRRNFTKTILLERNTCKKRKSSRKTDTKLKKR